jgi:hypothetical protein
MDKQPQRSSNPASASTPNRPQASPPTSRFKMGVISRQAAVRRTLCQPLRWATGAPDQCRAVLPNPPKDHG